MSSSFYKRSGGAGHGFLRRGRANKSRHEFQSSINGQFTSINGVDPSTTLGNTASEHQFDRGIQSSFGGVGKFSSTDYLRRKVPIISSATANPSAAYRDRLNGAINDLSGAIPDAEMDTVEREQLI